METPAPAALDFSDQPAASDFVSAASSAGVPITPPRPQGRAREKTSPPSGQARPAKKTRAPAARPPASRHGLSFPSTDASAPLTDHSWKGFAIRVEIKWRVPTNVTGKEAATSALRHYLGLFAGSRDLGSSVEGRETYNGIEIFIDSIHKDVPHGDVMNGLVKKVLNAVDNLKMHRLDKIRNCHFSTQIHERNVQHESSVLERIAGRRRTGFRSWIKVPPRPAAAPETEAAPGAVMPEPGEVALALGADIGNLRAGLDVAHDMKDIASMVDRAMYMLETVQTYLKGSPVNCQWGAGAGAGAVTASVAGISSTSPPSTAPPSAATSGSASGGHAIGTPGAGQPCFLLPVCHTPTTAR